MKSPSQNCLLNTDWQWRDLITSFRSSCTCSSPDKFCSSLFSKDATFSWKCVMSFDFSWVSAVTCRWKQKSHYIINRLSLHMNAAWLEQELGHCGLCEELVSAAILRWKLLTELALIPLTSPGNPGPLLTLGPLTLCRSIESCWRSAWSSCSFCSRALTLFSAPVFEAVTRSLHWGKADNEQIWIAHLRHSSTEKIQMILFMSGLPTLAKWRLSMEKSPWLSEAEAQRKKSYPYLSKTSWSAFGYSIV